MNSPKFVDMTYMPYSEKAEEIRKGMPYPHNLPMDEFQKLRKQADRVRLSVGREMAKRGHKNNTYRKTDKNRTICLVARGFDFSKNAYRSEESFRADLAEVYGKANAKASAIGFPLNMEIVDTTKEEWRSVCISYKGI